MSSAELMFKSATELAQMVKSGEITSKDLVEQSLKNIGDLDGELNAFTTTVPEMAIEEATKVTADDPRPFAGVPIAIKDLNVMTAGIRVTQGAELAGDYVPDYDSNQVRRIKEAGFVIVGKTSSPEFGIVPITEPRRFGPTRNPWNSDHTPGGSSGGTASAVAAGMVPLGHASDGGGSIRIPASCCGLVGLKPSRGRISKGPVIGEVMMGLSIDGTITRTVKDTARMLDILSGYEIGDPYWAEPPAKPFAEYVGEHPGKLKVGYSLEIPMGVSLDPRCAAAVEESVALLRDLGHTVEEFDPRWPDPAVAAQFTVLWGSGITQSIQIASMLAGGIEPTKDNVESLSWAFYQNGMSATAEQYTGAEMALQIYARDLARHWSQYDAVLTPVLAKPPVKVGEIDCCADDPWAEFQKVIEFAPVTAIINVTGNPAISLPLGFAEDLNLPVGVQFVGRAASEGPLIALASQIETARPWADKRPAVSANTAVSG